MWILLLPLDILILFLLWALLPWLAIAALVLVGLWLLYCVVRAAVRAGVQDGAKR